MSNRKELTVQAPNTDLMLSLLSRTTLHYELAKSPDIAPIIIGLGGGMGIATVVKALGKVIKDYLETARREHIRMKVGETEIVFNVSNASSAADLLSLALKASERS